MAEGSEMSVCCKCFGNAGLQYRIIELQADATTGPCEAHPNEMGIPLSVAADIIDAALRENFGSGISDEREEHLDGRDLDDLIHEIVQPADDELARILKDHLIDNDSYWRPDGEEVFYSDECTYFPTEIGTANYGTRWAQFRDHLMHDQRFFSRSAFGYLREIFEGVESRLDPEGKSPVYMIKPGDPASKFFRARGIRAIHDVKTFREDLAGELGPPPQRLRSAGRLNPAGVAVFYAAFDPITCVGELRPSVGSLVAVAEFKIEKPICVLDTTRYTAQPNPPNIFQPGAISEAAQWNFMRNFMQLIVTAVFRPRP